MRTTHSVCVCVLCIQCMQKSVIAIVTVIGCAVLVRRIISICFAMLTYTSIRITTVNNNSFFHLPAIFTFIFFCKNVLRIRTSKQQHWSALELFVSFPFFSFFLCSFVSGFFFAFLSSVLANMMSTIPNDYCVEKAYRNHFILKCTFILFTLPKFDFSEKIYLYAHFSFYSLLHLRSWFVSFFFLFLLLIFNATVIFLAHINSICVLIRLPDLHIMPFINCIMCAHLFI